MPQVSKNPLDNKTKQQIFDNFYNLIARLMHKEHITVILDSLFSKTEKMMVAKRIAAVILLDHGWSTRHICLTLKMSSATVAKFKNELDKGNIGLEDIARMFREDKKVNKIVEHLANILAEIIDFIPPHKNYIRGR